LTGNQAGSVNPPQTEGFLLAQTEISAEKIAAYRATDYRFGEGLDAITLRIDEALPSGCGGVGRPQRRAPVDFIALICWKDRFWEIDLIFKASSH